LNYETVNPRDLRPHPEFARLFEPAQADELARLQREMSSGTRFPPLLIDPLGQVLAGVEHWQTALKLGWDSISAVRAPRLNSSETRALMVAENVRQRDIREEHLWRGMNNFFDMEPLRPPGGW
jgi:hypothetical protein